MVELPQDAPTVGKLGKKLGVVEDPRTFKLRIFLPAGALPAAPKASMFSKDVLSYPMYANDVIGDCSCASRAHGIIIQERNSQQKEVRLTDEDVIKAYSAVTGYDPKTGANDNGAYLLDVLNYQRRVGMGTEKDGTPHTISGYMRLDHNKQEEVRLGSAYFGGLYLGIWLPISAQTQTVWDVPEYGPTGNGEPGSWGGHAVWMVGYDSSYVYFITWGRVTKMTWNFWHTYVDEAYAVVTEDFFKKGGRTARGFDVERLQSMLNELSRM